MKINKILIQKITMLVMLVITIASITLATTFIIKNNRTNDLLLSFQENSIVFTEEQYNATKDENKQFFTLTVKDGDDEYNLYILNIEGFQLDIYTALLISGSYKQSDFSSFDEVNFYFQNSDPNVYAKTDVLELQNDPNYYDLEWGSMIVGLQAIIIDKNLTVVKGVW